MPVTSPVEGTVYSEVVALQSLPLPPVLLDRVAGVDYDADLEAEGVGLIDIRSVYDIAGADTAFGVDTTFGGILVLRDPALTTAAARPVRFLRIEKAVSLPDRTSATSMSTPSA